MVKFHRSFQDGARTSGIESAKVPYGATLLTGGLMYKSVQQTQALLALESPLGEALRAEAALHARPGSVTLRQLAAFRAREELKADLTAVARREGLGD